MKGASWQRLKGLYQRMLDTYRFSAVVQRLVNTEDHHRRGRGRTVCVLTGDLIEKICNLVSVVGGDSGTTDQALTQSS